MDRQALCARLLAVIAEAGTQQKAAKRMRVSGAYISDVLHGRREPGEKLLRALGLKRVVQYEAK